MTELERLKRDYEELLQDFELSGNAHSVEVNKLLKDRKEMRAKLEAEYGYSRHLQRELGDSMEYQIKLKEKLEIATEALNHLAKHDSKAKKALEDMEKVDAQE